MSTLAETVELPPGLSRWTWTTDVWVDGGYQDNLLLSPDAREASPFARVGGDVSLALIPFGSFHFQANVNAEEKRFAEGVEVTHERYVGANVEMAYDLNKFWRLSLESHYLFEDQVYDASISSTNTSSILVHGHAFSLKPTLRRDFYGGWWVEVGGVAARQTFTSGDLDGYWDTGVRALLGKGFGKRSEWTVECSQVGRIYDHRERYTVDGIPLPGEPLEYRAMTLSGSLIHFWDAARRWRTQTKVGFERNHDNGSGYFGYNRVSASQQLRFRYDGWEAKAQVRVSNLEYDFQRADDGIAKRDRTSVRANLRLERQLYKGLRVHAEYEWERLFSNRELDGYSVNTVSAGLGWEY